MCEPAHPLIDQILTWLEANITLLKEGTSEFALIQHLQRPPQPVFGDQVLREPQSLFQTHFVLFHCLYRLRNHWRAQQVGELAIHTTSIRLDSWQPGIASLTQADPLQSYYLDWSHFEQTGLDEVNQLLDNFWASMSGVSREPVAPTQLSQARQIFGWEAPMPDSRRTLKQRYRELQHQHHPDKGGDPAFCQQIGWAYQVLQTTLA